MQLKLIILVFCNKSFKKRNFRSKIEEKTKINVEFWIFKLVFVPNFSLKWKICFLGPNLWKISISNLKQKNWTSILNFCIFELVYNHGHKIFFQPQVKRSVIISRKHDIYNLSHDSSNDLRLRILGNQEISEKSQNFIEL